MDIAATADPLLALRRAAAALSEAATRLPASDLLPEERMALAGHLLPCGPTLVEEVAAALCAAPDAFADFPISAGALRERQAEADAWLLLRNQLTALLQRAADHHLAAQSDATQCALRLLDRARGEAQLDGRHPSPRTDARVRALTGAELVLRTYRSEIAPHQSKASRPQPAVRRRLDAGLQRVFLRHLAASAARPSLDGLGTNGGRPGTVPGTNGGGPAAPRPPFSIAAPCTPTARAEIAPMNTPDLYQEFLAQVLGQANPPSGPAPQIQLSTEQLSELATEAAGAQGRSQAARLSPADRERLAGKRPTLLLELLIQCGEGLAAEQGFAAQVGVPAALVDKTAKQDAALGRLVKVSGDTYDASEEAAAQIAEDAQGLGEQALDAATRRAAGHPEEKSRIDGAFADARRLYQDTKDRAAKQKTKTDKKLRGQREALGKLQQETAELKLLHQVLDNGGNDHV